MNFWQIAFVSRWVTAEQLHIAVKTDTNPFGEITPEHYKEITKGDFETHVEGKFTNVWEFTF